jgi:hypothetical protein
MTHNCNVLIIGKADRIEILSSNHSYNITFAANYEEATEHLERMVFGHVITDAVLDDKTGIEVLQFIKKMPDRPRAYIVHTDHKFGPYVLPGYIGINFEDFAEFYLMEESENWHVLQVLKQCA